MHELALSQSIVDLVLERAAAERLRTVTRVVEVGAAAGVDPEALRFCFDAVAEATAARGAELVIIGVSLRTRCRTVAMSIVDDARLAVARLVNAPSPDRVVFTLTRRTPSAWS
jgi:hydrogenase nickel incorporation protein HypA/HybF